ncbi:ATP-binding cassette domain-containing protein [Saccharopolyspora hattusasensis]|uniref:ATP-binding cassette domain-containing protein n=1 Tax=Saccharopolyspora hattusasensis TaxID=1128679 RepID=UPI003D983499
MKLIGFLLTDCEKYVVSVVRVDKVSHSYGSHAALHQVCLRLPVGATALLGPNGAGKSTLLGLLSSALRLQRGSIDVDGLTPGRDSRRYREAMGFLPQQFSVPHHLTCAEFLELSAWWRKVAERNRKDVVRHALRAVELEKRAATKIGKLSGGMVRRLGIAQALVNAPKVLLLDEPTVGLDPRQRAGLRDVIVDLARSQTILVSTHLTEDVAAVADRVAVLDQGRVVFDGDLAEMAGKPAPTASDLDRAYDDLVGDGEAV